MTNYPSQPYPPVPAPRRRLWPWVLLTIASLAVAGCFIGVFAVGGAAKNIEKSGSSRLADVTISSCKVDSLGLGQVEYRIHNSSATAQTYLVQLRIEDAKGNMIGQGSDFADEVPAGKDFAGKMTATFNGDRGQDYKCVITDA